MNKFQNWTKIVITLGGATDRWWTWDVPHFRIDDAAAANGGLADALAMGAQIFRFNLSHGPLTDHIFRAKALRDYLTTHQQAGALMFDTKGPELRVGMAGAVAIVRRGDHLKIYSNAPNFVGDATAINVVDADGRYQLATDVTVGTTLYIEDGKLMLTVVAIDGGVVETRVESATYHLLPNKRVNIRGQMCSLPFLSDYDRQGIALAADLGVEYLALSFVQDAAQISAVRQLLAEHGGHTQIIAKIETQGALDNLAEVVAASDGVMVARGDLALNTNFTDLPYQEERIIRWCHALGKPVIVATQMLDSLERNNFPTRAEIADVYRAVELGASAVMLSGESAQGVDPSNAIQVMAQIIQQAEAHLDLPPLPVDHLPNGKPGIHVVADPTAWGGFLLHAGTFYLTETEWENSQK